MAFMKYARATVVHPHVGRREWASIRTAAAKVASADLQGNLVARASDLLGQQFDPKKYLLTHATIVASVDTLEPTGIKTGSVMEGGFRVNRKYGNFRVTLASDKFINNNLDCWDRDVLLKSYRTFVGGHNFVEHVQVEELSKGRIIDAVARDIGDSVYVDILIATDRKHADLVTAIESGKMGTLSMGCTVDGTQCTKCGHWAADETEMCPCIKYAKGNIFFDENGRKHRIAELCGHKSIGPTGGVQFIEASWVGTPAFPGAVLRNVLEPTGAQVRQAQAILASPPPEWSAEASMKAASLANLVASTTPLPPTTTLASSLPVTVAYGDTLGFDDPMAGDEFFSGWDDEEEAPAEEAAPAEKADPFKSLEDEMVEHLSDRVKKRLKEQMKGEEAKKILSPETPTTTNESVVKEASLLRVATDVLVRTAASPAALIDGVATMARASNINIPIRVYRAALTIGSSDRYADEDHFHRVCLASLGGQPTPAELRVLRRLGKLIARWESQNQHASRDFHSGSRHQGDPK